LVGLQEAADNLYKELIKQGLPCATLHGGMSQDDRDSTIADFRCGNIAVLVATSVAARGLDIKDLVVVINYEVPNHYAPNPTPPDPSPNPDLNRGQPPKP